TNHGWYCFINLSPGRKGGGKSPKKVVSPPAGGIKSRGAIIRGDTTKRVIYLVLTGHEFADGADFITKTLKEEKVKASFFFTGDFYRNKSFRSAIKKLKRN